MEPGNGMTHGNGMQVKDRETQGMEWTMLAFTKWHATKTYTIWYFRTPQEYFVLEGEALSEKKNFFFLAKLHPLVQNIHGRRRKAGA